MPDGRRGRVCPRGEKSAAYRHGHAAAHGGKSREYLTWRAMRGRCNNPNDPAYPRYGGRGVAVCDRWDRFENFLADMGPRPDGASLDRWPDNDGDYEPGNCRWATRKEQGRNMRSNNMLTARGQTLCIKDWADRLGVDPGTIRHRIRKGWSVEKAVTAPKGSLPPRRS